MQYFLENTLLCRFLPILISSVLPLLFNFLSRREAKWLQRSRRTAKTFPYTPDPFWGETFQSYQLLPIVAGSRLFSHYAIRGEKNPNYHKARATSMIWPKTTQAETCVIYRLFSVLSDTRAEDGVLIGKVLSTTICPAPGARKDPWSQSNFFWLSLLLFQFKSSSQKARKTKRKCDFICIRFSPFYISLYVL